MANFSSRGKNYIIKTTDGPPGWSSPLERIISRVFETIRALAGPLYGKFMKTIYCSKMSVQFLSSFSSSFNFVFITVLKKLLFKTKFTVPKIKE